MIEPNHPDLSIRRQCALLELPRSSYYYVPASETPLNMELMRRIDKQYLKTPFYGSPRMTAYLRQAGYGVNRKRIQRLMHLMGIQAIYPKPKTTSMHPDHKIYPYLLRNLVIAHPNQVWSAEIV